MNRKKIFVPLLIIFILIINMLVSTIYTGFMSFAVDTDGISASVDTSDINNIKLTLGGNVEGNIISIKYTDVYISINEALDYFDNPSSSYIDVTDKNQGASNSVLAVTIENVKEGKTYTVAIDIDMGNGQIKTMIKQKDIVILNNGGMKISIERKAENNSNVIINVISSANDIVLLKVAKASEISKDEDFKTKGEAISITPSLNVTATYQLKEEGEYKIYAEDSRGKGIILNTEFLHITSTKEIKILHKKGDNNALIIKAKDSEHKITEMKIMLSNSEVSKEDIANNGTPISITAGTKVQGEYTISGNSTYVTVYVKDEYGAEYKHGQTINSIKEDDTIVVPVDPDPTPDPTPDDSQGSLVVPMPDNNESGNGSNDSNNKNSSGDNSSNNQTIIGDNILDNQSQNSNESNSLNIQTNIQSDEQINSSNNESLPKTGVEDTGIILLIVTLVGIAIVSFIKFIRIK